MNKYDREMKTAQNQLKKAEKNGNDRAAAAARDKIERLQALYGDQLKR